MSTFPVMEGGIYIPSRGKSVSARLENVGIQRLPSDPAGSTTITLNNVVVGSRYRIEVASTGALATPTANAEGVAGSSSFPIGLDFFASGNVNNDIRIKVRKGTSSPVYQPYETQATLISVNQSVFISQVLDE